jgi:RNA polymerase sigma-70 factor (ECF subfamily)
VIADLVKKACDDASPLAAQHAAFSELVRRFDAMALSIALRTLGDMSEAQDAAQEAFVTAWLKLRTLREPRAFGAWLKRLVRTQCYRRLRKRASRAPDVATTTDFSTRSERQSAIARAMAALSPREYRAVVLFYFLGRSLNEIAPDAGKTLYNARLKLRKGLPRSFRDEFVRRRPSAELACLVRWGVFDQYVGTYRFDRRPDLTVKIERRDDRLISIGTGQQNVLASIDEARLITHAYDGEGRFRRDAHGKVTHFIYYEFGKRLGIARKVR